ncbi:MAG: PhnD/SsuA/transferrin family substrate-binding protein [Proteobacteria bacterium]|nr:PhnD/SsuA/transferrin family substrate-binding protein [Pseudomonadota bacterium]
MSRFVANARMYAVTPSAEAAWRALLGHVAADAEVDLDYLPYPAPQPLEDLWRRGDLGAVQMCGYPIALRIADVVPLAAPIPSPSWAGGHAVYRSDFIVREDSPARTLADTFGGRIGWTVAHSHSGFNAPRHHLLRYRTAGRPALYRESVGNLVTARRIIDSVVDGTIDVGPLDGYWHALIARHLPELTARIRVVESTDLAPIPAFVAAPALPEAAVGRLRTAFAAASSRPWFAALAEPLLVRGFSPVTRGDFARTLGWDEEAKLAGYAVPE